MKPPLNILTFPLLLVGLALAAVEFYPVLLWGIKHYALYKWFGAGFGAYFMLRLLPFFRKNEGFMQTFSHELTHLIVSLMFGQKNHSFRASDGEGGEMRHSDSHFGGIFISLAPYCLPIFTYAFLFLRIIGAWKQLMWFDIFIGFTLAFHTTCFAKQTGNRQTDIQQYGYFKSYLFIAVLGLFNITIILLCIRKGIINSATYLFSEYWDDIVMAWKYLF
jgi:hypothetical protein